MTCSEFDKAFDPYVDGMLDPVHAAAARAHVKSCTNCDRMVARWQQSRILLSTAVAEIATAVDVSGLFAAVQSALDEDAAGQSTTTRRQDRREARRETELRPDRVLPSRTTVRPDRPDRTVRPAARQGRFASLRRFGTLTGSAAVAAAASIMLLTPGTSPIDPVQPVAGLTPASVSTSRVAPARGIRTINFRPASEGSQWNPLSPPSRPSALVDALEPGEGRTVSTWVQPRTQARVIWVESRDSGPTVQTAGYQR